jgi:hypothetical protein
MAGRGVYCYRFSISSLGVGEPPASRSGYSSPRGNDFQYPLKRRLGGHRSRSGHYGGTGNLLHLPAIEPRILGYAARSLIAVPSRRR